MDFVFNFAMNNLKDFTMKAIDIIKTRQLEWAKRIIGKENLNKDYPFYCKEVENNIFCDKDSKGLSDIVEAQIRRGSGNELKDGDTEPAKIKAVFSSSALCVNVLQYFAIGNENNVLDFLRACKLISNNYQGDVIPVDFEYENKNIQVPIRFEEKFETGIPYGVPNLDAVIRTKSKTGKKQLFAFESKFSEPYSSHRGNFLKEKYCSKENREIWIYKDCDIYKALKIDNKENICRLIKKDEKEEREEGRYIFDYKYLDGAQLVKHILGATNSLKNNPEEENTEITLVYLWYDALGAEGAMHREEIEDFRKTIEDATSQKIKVRHATYQEVICNLCEMLDDSHRDYLNYITERYL